MRRSSYMEALWKLETSVTCMNLVSGRENGDSMTKDRDEMVQDQSDPSRSLGEVAVWVSPRPVKLNEDLADCAVVGKELWYPLFTTHSLIFDFLSFILIFLFLFSRLDTCLFDGVFRVFI